jgi:predicted DNA binding CopG/RHH family protein
MARAERSATRKLRVIAERVQEDEKTSELINRLEAEADREVASHSVTLRWRPAQIAVVKRAAAIFGVPYQTYMKQVVFRQALEDLRQAEAALHLTRGDLRKSPRRGNPKQRKRMAPRRGLEPRT